MIVIITVFVLLYILCGWANDWNDSSIRKLVTGFCLTIWAVMWFIVLGGSYSGYLDNRAYYAIGLQTELQAIEMYRLDSNMLQYESLTDSRGSGFQQAMAKQINTLNDNVSRYNNWYISRTNTQNNWLINWFFVAPDSDMGLLVVNKNLDVAKSGN